MNLLKQVGSRRLSILALGFLLTACGDKEAKPTAQTSAGESLYVKNCKVCHAQGINGAPLLATGKCGVAC